MKKLFKVSWIDLDRLELLVVQVWFHVFYFLFFSCVPFFFASSHVFDIFFVFAPWSCWKAIASENNINKGLTKHWELRPKHEEKPFLNMLTRSWRQRETWANTNFVDRRWKRRRMIQGRKRKMRGKYVPICYCWISWIGG